MTQLLQRPDGHDGDKPKSPPSADERNEALRRMLVVVAAGILAAIVTHTTKTVLVIVAVMLMIMLHEFGHFAMAKRAGMKVTEFFLGFGPRLWSIRKGETEYGVKAVVLAGGYVRIAGMTNLEEVDPEDEPRSYRAASFPNKLSVVTAGSVMHFIIAFVLLLVLNSVVGVIHTETRGAQVREIIAFKDRPSPAQLSGLKPGDIVLRADGHEVDDRDLTAYIKEHPGQAIQLDVMRDGTPLQIALTPVDVSTVNVPTVKSAKGAHTGFVGVGVGQPYHIEKSANPVVAIGRAGRDLGHITALSARGLADLVSFHGIRSYGDQLSGKVPTNSDPGNQPRLLSPVGLVRVASQAAESGIREVLFLLIAINVFVGMLNMAPLLPFDGGHVAVAIYERIRSRKGKRYRVDIAKLMPVTYAVVMILFFVTITALYLDIAHPLKLQ